MINSNTYSAKVKRTIGGILFIVALCLVGSLDAPVHAASKTTSPSFDQQVAFHLTPDDVALYGAQYGWCFPTAANGVQCYVLGSTMVGWLGVGDSDQKENLATFGDVSKGLVPITRLPKEDVIEALSAFTGEWPSK